LARDFVNKLKPNVQDERLMVVYVGPKTEENANLVIARNVDDAIDRLRSERNIPPGSITRIARRNEQA